MVSKGMLAQQFVPALWVFTQPFPTRCCLVLLHETAAQVIDMLLLPRLDKVNQSVIEGPLHEQIHTRHDQGSRREEGDKYLESD